MRPRPTAAARAPRAPWLLVLAVAATPAFALHDLPVAGRRLAITTSGAGARSLVFRSAADARIAPPLPDPAAGARLAVFTSNADGQCRADVVLPAAFWTPVGGAGAARGWRYRDPDGTAGGVRAVTIATGRSGRGRLAVHARGAGFPCAVTGTQALPVQVALEVGGTRWCAAFDHAHVRANRAGRLRAARAPAPGACPDTDLTVATLNVLHGLFCPPDTGNCRLADRIALLRAWIAARGCPDVVALQEVATVIPTMRALLEDALLDACPWPYHAVLVPKVGFDEQMVLSRHRVLESELRGLLGPLRSVTRARVDHPLGAVDVYSTHLASGSDRAGDPCDAFGPCPPECLAAGATTVRTCQGVQAAAIVEETRNPAMPAFLAGDLNVEPGSFLHRQLAARGWIDAFLAGGNAECDPATGSGCTSGREDEALGDLEAPASNQVERIDYVFVVPPQAPSACTPSIDSAADADGDGIATRLFADAPNPFAPACGPLPASICWPSDHAGVQVDLNCR